MKRPRLVFLAACSVLYAPWLFLGYGLDDDAYRIVRTGRVLVEEGRYVGSRNPGYLVPEMGTLVLDHLGSSVATNAGTLALALLALWAFWGLCIRLGVQRPLPVLLCLAMLPVFWLNATATMDHVWALGFLLTGWLALLDRRPLLGGLLLGLAIGSRLTSVIAVCGVLGYTLWIARERRSVVRAGGLAVLVGAACYLPSAAEYGWTLGFLEPAGLGGPELWTWPLRLGRWGYKNIYLWGLPATLALAGLLAFALRQWRQVPAPLGVLVVGVVLAYEALFLRYPLDPAYLLPAVVFMLLGLGVALGDRAHLLGVLAALILLSGLVTINLARPDRAFAARDAALGVWVEPGALVRGAHMRWQLRGCETVACWHEQLGVPPEEAP